MSPSACLYYSIRTISCQDAFSTSYKKLTYRFLRKRGIKLVYRMRCQAGFMQHFLKAIPHKERLATLHAICLQISLQSLFRIFSHASCVHIFRDISGKYSKIHKGFSPFFPSSLKKSDNAICIRQIRNRLSYFTKMLVNTSSIHSAFCFI